MGRLLYCVYVGGENGLGYVMFEVTFIYLKLKVIISNFIDKMELSWP